MGYERPGRFSPPSIFSSILIDRDFLKGLGLGTPIFCFFLSGGVNISN